MLCVIFFKAHGLVSVTVLFRHHELRSAEGTALGIPFVCPLCVGNCTTVERQVRQISTTRYSRHRPFLCERSCYLQPHESIETGRCCFCIGFTAKVVYFFEDFSQGTESWFRLSCSTCRKLGKWLTMRCFLVQIRPENKKSFSEWIHNQPAFGVGERLDHWWQFKPSFFNLLCGPWATEGAKLLRVHVKCRSIDKGLRITIELDLERLSISRKICPLWKPKRIQTCHIILIAPTFLQHSGIVAVAIWHCRDVVVTFCCWGFLLSLGFASLLQKSFRC